MAERDTTLPAHVSPEMARRYQRMQRLAWLLDNSIRIPVIGYRIGLDAILGLIPGVGDAAGAILSGYIFYAAARMKAPLSLLGRMAANIVVELLVGMFPLLGDLFDATFKSNARNMRLVEAWLQQPAQANRRNRLLLGGLGGGIALLLLAGVLAGIVVLILVLRLLTRLI